MYSLFFTEKAARQIEGLEQDVRERILSVLERIRVRPQAFVKRLVGRKFYRLRVGDYRVIVDIEHGRLLVVVLEVGHRKNIYD